MKELNVIERTGRLDGRGAGRECVSAITKEPRHFFHLAHVPRVDRAVPVERCLSNCRVAQHAHRPLERFVVNSTGLICIAGCAVGRFGATAERAPRFKPTICFPSAEHVTAALPQGSVREIKVSPNPRESFKLCQDAHSAASNLVEAPVQIGAWAETNGATA
jgi:hypothetical protein